MKRLDLSENQLSNNAPSNPFAPPSIDHPATIQPNKESPRAKPIIPALIGVFTYGSTSPYALVLCIEQYLRRSTTPPLLSTQIALPLAILGTIGWIGFNIVMAVETVDNLLGGKTTSYGNLGLFLWIADAAFIVWALWRMQIFRREVAQQKESILPH